MLDSLLTSLQLKDLAPTVAVSLILGTLMVMQQRSHKEEIKDMSKRHEDEVKMLADLHTEKTKAHMAREKEYSDGRDKRDDKWFSVMIEVVQKLDKLINHFEGYMAAKK